MDNIYNAHIYNTHTHAHIHIMCAYVEWTYICTLAHIPPLLEESWEENAVRGMGRGADFTSDQRPPVLSGGQAESECRCSQGGGCGSGTLREVLLIASIFSFFQ